MEIRIIDQKQFDDFASTFSRSHFMQTSAWGDVNLKRNYTSIYVGFFNGKMIGAGLLLEKKVLLYKTYYCPRGPLIDYSDKKIVEETFNLLKIFIKTRKGLYLKFNPDLLIRELDENANPIKTFSNNLELIDVFKKLGAKHRGFTKKFTESSAPRFTFRVNVDKSDEELIDSFHSTTKKIIKRNNPYKIDVYKGSSNDLIDFYNAMKETCLRKDIYLEPFDYFKDFYEVLNKCDKSDLFLAKANISKLKEIYRLKFEELQKSYEELDKLVEKKKESRKKSLDEIKTKLEKEYAQIESIKEDEIILSSIITAKHKDKVWTIHGGNSDKLMFLNGNYELYYYILKDSHLNGYKIVDFFGSDGEVDKNSPIYGIFLFKLRFGGIFEEYIGEFDLITNRLAYCIIMKLLVLRRKLLR